MTIENPRKSRSQERSENSRRERSPPRESRRRNSSGTDTSRRSRRRSGPAGFSSAATVTLKEDDKVSKNRVDFRQVDKSRARYMGLCKLLYSGLSNLSTKNRLLDSFFLFLRSQSRQVSLDRLFSRP